MSISCRYGSDGIRLGYMGLVDGTDGDISGFCGIKFIKYKDVLPTDCVICLAPFRGPIFR